MAQVQAELLENGSSLVWTRDDNGDSLIYSNGFKTVFI